MATITSASSGVYTTGATWVGGAAPVDGDDAIIATGHAITGFTGTVGSFGAAGTGNAILFQGTGSLTMSAGATATIKGAVSWAAAATGDFVTGAGCTITTNTAVAQTWTFQSGALFNMEGTSGSRCIFNKTGGSANHSLAGGSGGKLRLTYTDISDKGASGTPWWQNSANVDSNETTLTNCTLTSCGSTTALGSTSATISINGLDIYTPLNNGDDIYSTGNHPTARTNDRIFANIRIHRSVTSTVGGLYIWGEGFKVYDCVLVGSVIAVDISPRYFDIYRNYCRRDYEAGTALYLAIPSSTANCNIYDNYVNGYSWCMQGPTGTGDATCDIYQNVLEGTAAALTHQEVDYLRSNWKFRNNLVLGYNNVAQLLQQSQCPAITHNTFYTTTGSAILTGYAGGVIAGGNAKSNIFCGNMAGTYTAVADEDATAGGWTEADYNVFTNLGAGAQDNYSNILITGKTERVDAGFAYNDLPVGGSVNAEVNPQFVNAGFTTTKTTAQMLAGTYTTADILAEYREAYRPQNSALATAGHDGTAIGAIAYVAGGVASLGKTSNSFHPGRSPGLAPASARFLAQRGAYTRAAIVLTASVGTHTLSGQPVTTKYGRVVSVATGAYSLSGQAVTTRRGYPLTAAVGAYSVAGQAVNTLYGRKVVAVLGTYALAGQNVNTLYGRLLSTALGTYSLAGQDVILTYTPATGAYTLVAEVGNYSVSGNDARLVKQGENNSGGYEDYSNHPYLRPREKEKYIEQQAIIEEEIAQVEIESVFNPPRQKKQIAALESKLEFLRNELDSIKILNALIAEQEDEEEAIFMMMCMMAA